MNLIEINQARNTSYSAEEEGSSSSSAAARKRVEELLRQLREGQRPKDDSPETTTDQFLNALCYKDFPALHCAQAKLTVKAKDKKLDVFFQSRITAMVATLNFYLDPELSYSWQESSVLAAKAMECGVKRARNLRKWINKYLYSEKLPLHRYGTYHSSVLEDEDLRRDIQLHLMEIAKKGYIRAQDIVDYVATPEVQQRLGTRARGIHLRTAQRWLHKLSSINRRRRECTSMVMSARMWYNTGRSLSNAGGNMKNVSSFTRTTEVLFLHPLDFLFHKVYDFG